MCMCLVVCVSVYMCVWCTACVCVQGPTPVEMQWPEDIGCSSVSLCLKSRLLTEPSLSNLCFHHSDSDSCYRQMQQCPAFLKSVGDLNSDPPTCVESVLIHRVISPVSENSFLGRAGYVQALQNHEFSKLG